MFDVRIVVDEDNEVQLIPYMGYIIGSSPEAHIQLFDESVVPYHAIANIVRSGVVSVISYNGTPFLSGGELTTAVEVSTDGTLLRFGNVPVTVRIKPLNCVRNETISNVTQ